MAYDAKGHVRPPGEATVGTGAGSVKRCHLYFTNDDAAAVETAGYFNVAEKQFASGDQIDVSLDIDGTVGLRSYVVKNTAGVIALTLSGATAVV